MKISLHEFLRALLVISALGSWGCGGGGGSGAQSSSAPTPLAIQSFTTSTPTVSLGGKATMTAVFSGGAGSVYGVGTVQSGVAFQTPALAVAGPVNFTLQVADTSGAKVIAAVQVQVMDDAPAITSFTATPPAVQDGGPVSLLADFTGGTGAIDQQVGLVTSGTAVTVTPPPSATTSYILTVTSSTGVAVTKAVNVTSVPAPLIQEFTATPAIADNGKSVTLLARFTGGTGNIEGVGPVVSGVPVSVTPPPSATTPYTLTVTSPVNTVVSLSTSVEAVPPASVISYAITPAVVTNGQPVTITAVFVGGTGVIAGLGPITSGQPITVVPPASAVTPYTLIVTSPSGTSASLTATATAVPPPKINYFTIQ